MRLASVQGARVLSHLRCNETIFASPSLTSSRWESSGSPRRVRPSARWCVGGQEAVSRRAEGRMQGWQRGGVPFLPRNLIVVGFQSAGRLQRRPSVCFDHLEYLLISRVAAERIQIRVVLDPAAPQFVTCVRKQPFQQIKSVIYIAEQGIDTGDIVLSQNIIRINQ